MNILGLSYNYHDAAACLVRNGTPVAAAEEERFTRRKHDSSFPAHAIEYCLREGGLPARGLDGIAFYEKPARKLERVLQTARTHAPASLPNLARQLPPLVSDGLLVEQTIRDRLDFQGPVYFCEHHLSHAASVFFRSPFEEAAILTVDGVGEWTTCGRFSGTANRIEKRFELHYPHSLGLFYSAMTAYLGFAVNDDEYKVMGLASYGEPSLRPALERLLTINDDGSFALDLSYFNFMRDATSMFSPALVDLLGPARAREGLIEKRHADIAASLQALTEDAMLALARASHADSAASNLCLAGGVALNCVANSQIAARAGFSGLFIQPAPGDSGAAMGAALWATHQLHALPRSPCTHDTLLGPQFDEADILQSLQAMDVAHSRLEPAALCERVAGLIRDNLIVGWFQGRMEFGPRALGSRSILANPCSPEMKDVLNARVKRREEFRPFAPAVIEEAAERYFELSGPSPFMLQTPRVREGVAEILPSITHVDGTARVQTVSKVISPLFHQLISCFGELTGVPVLINTSFNVRGEPIVCTPRDAIRCFLGTDIDFLAIGPYLATKA